MDVGHQSYTHNGEGRKDGFGTLRQDGGISGFPSRKESPYDVFDTGHRAIPFPWPSASPRRKSRRARLQDRGCDRDGSLTGGSLRALNMRTFTERHHSGAQ